MDELMVDETRQTYSMQHSGGELTLLDYWRVVCKQKRLIGVLCAGAVLISLIASLISPKIYKSKATILMPKEGGVGSQVAVSLGAGGGASSALAGLGGLSGLAMQFAPTLNRDIFFGVLNSKSLKEEVLEQLKKSWGPAAGSLITEVTISSEKELATIVVEVSAKDPKLSADAANFYFETLNQRLIRQGSAQMGVQKSFVVDRMAMVSKELDEAENAFKNFQIQNKFIALDSQAKGGIDTGASMRGQLITAELELERIRSFATESHPQVIQLKKLIVELKRQMARSQYGQPLILPSEDRNSGKTREEFFVPTVRQPELYFRMLRLYRDVKVQEAVYTFLTQQLESLKLSEASEMPQVQFLDRAKPPSGSSRPRPIYNMTAAGIGSLILGILLALFLDYIERLRSLEEAQRIA